MRFMHFKSKSTVTKHIFTQKGGCMRFIKFAAGLGAAVSSCMAQTITGTVTDSLNPGTPIAVATVTLKKSGVTTTTDLAGNFTLNALSTGTISDQAIASSAPVALSARGEIQLNLGEAARVMVKTYSAQGKQIAAMAA